MSNALKSVTMIFTVYVDATFDWKLEPKTVHVAKIVQMDVHVQATNVN